MRVFAICGRPCVGRLTRLPSAQRQARERGERRSLGFTGSYYRAGIVLRREPASPAPALANVRNRGCRLRDRPLSPIPPAVRQT